MELMQRRRELMATSNGNVFAYKTEYTLTENTKYGDFIRDIHYRVHFNKPVIIIRANGENAPTIGQYTVNNLVLSFANGAVVRCRHSWHNARSSPSDYEKDLDTKESSPIFLSDGVLNSDSRSDSCIGTTGTHITLIELDNLFDL